MSSRGATRRAPQHVAVHVAVHPDLVPALGDRTRDAGVAARHLTEHEERGAPAERVEHVEELRRRLGIGAVVERERDVALAADAHERGREPHADGRHAAERGRRVHHRDRRRTRESGRADETNRSRRTATGSAQFPERRGAEAGRLELGVEVGHRDLHGRRVAVATVEHVDLPGLQRRRAGSRAAR